MPKSKMTQFKGQMAAFQGFSEKEVVEIFGLATFKRRQLIEKQT